MPLNLIKKYPELLDINGLNEKQRTASLRGVFNQDIQNNPAFMFRAKQIRPIHTDGEASMGNLFNHLTREEITEKQPDGSFLIKRIFEKDRSVRIHWIKFHVNECRKDNVLVFSKEERSAKKRKNIIRTYIYDVEEKYVIVMEPQRSNRDYFLLTAYYLNRSYAEKQMRKKLANVLSEVY